MIQFNFKGNITYIFPKEDRSHSMQSLLRPGCIPVNTAVIDQAREVTTTSPKCFPHGGHCQYNVKIVCAFSYKILPYGLTSRWKSSFVCLVTYLKVLTKIQYVKISS